MGIENPVHLLFIAAVALVVLGPKRLPDLAKALGHGIREFRESMTEGEEEQHLAADPPAAPKAPAAAASDSPVADPAAHDGAARDAPAPPHSAVPDSAVADAAVPDTAAESPAPSPAPER
jgi:sec-independent protein translocase protein TatA